MIEQIQNFNKSFNAKSTSKQNLTESFIPNGHFDRLTSPNHTIMIGPRGSGKTTLLRMCELEALDIWSGTKSDKYRSRIDFTGVFIPTDRFWKAQYDLFREKFKEDALLKKLLLSSFTYHILECFSNTLIYRTLMIKDKKSYFRHINLSKHDEVEMVEQLSCLWCVETKIPSLRGLAIALALKKHEISSFLSSSDGTKQSNKVPKFADSNIISLLDASIQIVNIYFADSDGKWAFLFDELELAPDSFVQPLIDNMRGGPQNLILKLALSPYHKDVSITHNSYSSMHKQDLSFINLSGVREDGLEFAKTLTNNIFKKQNLTNPINSYFETIDIDRDKEFSELCERDQSFYNYCQKQGILGKSYADLTQNQQAAFRRIQFNVHLRNYYKRPRKRASHYYTGFENICKLLDYNPRMLVGVMSIFSSIAKVEGIIKVHRQLKCIDDYYQSFKALLNTIAVDSNEKNFKSLYDVITKIASFFEQQIHGQVFSPDPRGTITFDHEFNANYMEAIGLALNAGALVIEKNDTDSFHDTNALTSSRCRLSYIFSPKFKLLTNVQPPIDLDEILHKREIRVFDLFAGQGSFNYEAN
ncbi:MULTISPECIES: ORC-CDC6 family AAA ATPase [unclassified Pseudoalteromonas]|uniref:ORC-CDC6 family AAA ATPase n=1 Tax=unclassified Pseudoalteromonas TaxID=194690 RepID=UPI0006CA0D5D|nr:MULTISPECIES: hypothetical protein [unclassified Pseudoalteromonas]KPM80270.1 hypothetical protein AOG26_02995 [Pseudoalteromonas sp. UCD-33C]MBQ4862643.1 hypothetical protein [Pseudoalteromonas sp. MMG013]